MRRSAARHQWRAGPRVLGRERERDRRDGQERPSGGGAACRPLGVPRAACSRQRTVEPASGRHGPLTYSAEEWWRAGPSAARPAPRWFLETFWSAVVPIPARRVGGRGLRCRPGTSRSPRNCRSRSRAELATDNRLRHRIGLFAEDVLSAIDSLGFDSGQKLLRLVVEKARVAG